MTGRGEGGGVEGVLFCCASKLTPTTKLLGHRVGYLLYVSQAQVFFHPSSASSLEMWCVNLPSRIYMIYIYIPGMSFHVFSSSTTGDHS